MPKNANSVHPSLLLALLTTQCGPRRDAGVTGGLSTLAVWLRARANQRKHFRASVDGMELTGYEADEAERIIRLLQSKVYE